MSWPSRHDHSCWLGCKNQTKQANKIGYFIYGGNIFVTLLTLFFFTDCSYNGRIYSHGSSFPSEEDRCINCTCDNSVVECVAMNCPRMNLPCRRPITEPGDCCPSRCPSKKCFYVVGAISILTLKVPITTNVVCFCRLLKCFRSLTSKQRRPRSDCSYRSSLIWVHSVCLYA